MKVQWRLVGLDTGELIGVLPAMEFDGRFLKEEWKRQLTGTSKIKNPRGILNCKKKK